MKSLRLAIQITGVFNLTALAVLSRAGDYYAVHGGSNV